MESQNFDNDQDLIDAVGDFDGPIYDYYISAPLSSSSANIPTGETRKGNSNNTAKDNDMFGWNSKNQYQPVEYMIVLESLIVELSWFDDRGLEWNSDGTEFCIIFQFSLPTSSLYRIPLFFPC